MVLSHHGPEKLRERQLDVPIQELRNEYKDFDPCIKRIVDTIDGTSSPSKNVVLIDDAAHSMINHMAQGAATSMEDGAFLARCIARVVDGTIRLDEAVRLYEEECMPKAHAKQQVSFINRAIWHLLDGLEQRGRDKAMEEELRVGYITAGAICMATRRRCLTCTGTMPKLAHAEAAMATYLNGGREPFDPRTGVTKTMQTKHVEWFTQRGKQYSSKL